jgi:hypothetical protein
MPLSPLHQDPGSSHPDSFNGSSLGDSDSSQESRCTATALSSESVPIAAPAPHESLHPHPWLMPAISNAAISCVGLKSLLSDSARFRKVFCLWPPLWALFASSAASDRRGCETTRPASGHPSCRRIKFQRPRTHHDPSTLAETLQGLQSKGEKFRHPPWLAFE